MDAFKNSCGSLSDIDLFTDHELLQIWDFYVGSSSASSQAGRGPKGYQKGVSDKSLYGDLVRIASSDPNLCIMLKADRMNKTLCELGFCEMKNGRLRFMDSISVEEPRWCCLQRYEIHDQGKPRAKNGYSALATLLFHVRNALAHGRIYQVSDSHVFLYDKNTSNVVTACFLIKARTLIDWIKCIDIDGRYYFKDDDRSEVRRILE